MTRMFMAVMLAIGCLGLLGCPEEETDAVEETTEATEETTEETAEVEEAADEEVVPSEEELPIPEDFADEAETQITEENYEAELDRLAQEIEADIEGGGEAEGEGG